MKTRLLLLLFLFAMTLAGCRTSKDGCAGAKYQGERYKGKTFKFY